MVCPMCVGAAVAQSAPVIVAAVSGATAARLAFQKQFNKRPSAKLSGTVRPAAEGKASYKNRE